MSENEVGHDVFAVSRASGAVGGRVATRLASLGHGQRLIVRNIDRARPTFREPASPRAHTMTPKRCDGLWTA